MNFDLILEHKDTQQLKFITVEDCVDMDDCINYIQDNEKDFWITQIKHSPSFSLDFPPRTTN
jgi:hypothetical protein